MTDTHETASFRLAYVPGVTPAKWVRVWNERLPEVPMRLALVTSGESGPALHAGTADAALLRLPVDRTGLHAIPLYTENTVVVLPKDHELAESEELSVADLAELLVLHPQDDCLDWEAEDASGLPGQRAMERPETTRDAIDLVEAGVGVVIVPQSLARLYHRRELTFRPLADAPQSRVALAWLEDQTTDLIEELIGVVRGRTVNSSRGQTAAAAANMAPKQKKQSGGSGARGGSGGSGGQRGGSGGGAKQGAGKGGSGARGGAARGGSRGGAKASRPKRRS